MERPADLLAEQAVALAQRVRELAWAGDAASLAQVFSGCTDADLLDLVERAGALGRLVDAVGSSAAGEVAARSARGSEEPLARRLGEKNAATAVAVAGGVPLARAFEWCAVGKAVAPRQALTGQSLPPRFPLVAAELDAGRLPLDSAKLVLCTLEAIAATALPDGVEWAERFLVGAAAEFAAPQLRGLARQLIDRFDPDGAEPREDALRAKSGLRYWDGPDGLVHGRFAAHPEAAGYIKAALEARLGPRRQVRFDDPNDPGGDPDSDPLSDAGTDGLFEDTRTLDQKRLDAFVDICAESVQRDPGDLSGTAVTVLVGITEEALRTGIGTATIFGVDEPISAATARRMACDAKILPIVLGGDSQPVDLGRARRLFSQQQRYAMVLRDGGGCIVPTCQAPPSQCQAAHIQGWDPDGCTDLANGALFCRFHHRMFDQGGWQLTRINGVPHLIPPRWVDAQQRPRRAGRPRLPTADTG